MISAALESVEARVSAPTNEEGHVLLLGSPRCGKSTLAAVLAGGSGAVADAPPPPTVGLSYTCARAPTGCTRELAHCWEVGGPATAAIADWLQVPLTPQRLATGVLLLVLDCGAPRELCATAALAYAAVRQRVDECCEKLAKATGRGAPDALYSSARARMRSGFAQRAGQRVGSDEHLPPHPDEGTSSLLPFPVIIVASRWDLLQDAERNKRRIVLCTLRFISLSLGGALVGVTSRNSASILAFRSLFLHAALGGEAVRGAIVDDDGSKGPPLVPTGSDFLDAILGAARIGESSPLATCSRAELDVSSRERTFVARLARFEAALEAAFPSAAEGKGAGFKAFDDESGGESISPLRHPEPSIDVIVAARAEEAARAAREAKDRERRLLAEARASAAATPA